MSSSQTRSKRGLTKRHIEDLSRERLQILKLGGRECTESDFEELVLRENTVVDKHQLSKTLSRGQTIPVPKVDRIRHNLPNKAANPSLPSVTRVPFQLPPHYIRYNTAFDTGNDGVLDSSKLDLRQSDFNFLAHRNAHYLENPFPSHIGELLLPQQLKSNSMIQQSQTRPQHANSDHSPNDNGGGGRRSSYGSNTSSMAATPPVSGCIYTTKGENEAVAKESSLSGSATPNNGSNYSTSTRSRQSALSPRKTPSSSPHAPYGRRNSTGNSISITAETEAIKVESPISNDKKSPIKVEKKEKSCTPHNIHDGIEKMIIASLSASPPSPNNGQQSSIQFHNPSIDFPRLTAEKLSRLLYIMEYEMHQRARYKTDPTMYLPLPTMINIIQKNYGAYQFDSSDIEAVYSHWLSRRQRLRPHYNVQRLCDRTIIPNTGLLSTLSAISKTPSLHTPTMAPPAGEFSYSGGALVREFQEPPDSNNDDAHTAFRPRNTIDREIRTRRQTSSKSKKNDLDGFIKLKKMYEDLTYVSTLLKHLRRLEQMKKRMRLSSSIRDFEKSVILDSEFTKVVQYRVDTITPPPPETMSIFRVLYSRIPKQFDSSYFIANRDQNDYRQVAELWRIDLSSFYKLWEEMPPLDTSTPAKVDETLTYLSKFRDIKPRRDENPKLPTPAATSVVFRDPEVNPSQGHNDESSESSVDGPFEWEMGEEFTSDQIADSVLSSDIDDEDKKLLDRVALRYDESLLSERIENAMIGDTDCEYRFFKSTQFRRLNDGRKLAVDPKLRPIAIPQITPDMNLSVRIYHPHYKTSDKLVYQTGKRMQFAHSKKFSKFAALTATSDPTFLQRLKRKRKRSRDIKTIKTEPNSTSSPASKKQQSSNSNGSKKKEKNTDSGGDIVMKTHIGSNGGGNSGGGGGVSRNVLNTAINATSTQVPSNVNQSTTPTSHNTTLAGGGTTPNMGALSNRKNMAATLSSPALHNSGAPALPPIGGIPPPLQTPPTASGNRSGPITVSNPLAMNSNNSPTDNFRDSSITHLVTNFGRNINNAPRNTIHSVAPISMPLTPVAVAPPTIPSASNASAIAMRNRGNPGVGMTSGPLKAGRAAAIRNSNILARMGRAQHNTPNIGNPALTRTGGGILSVAPPVQYLPSRMGRPVKTSPRKNQQTATKLSTAAQSRNRNKAKNASTSHEKKRSGGVSNSTASSSAVAGRNVSNKQRNSGASPIAPQSVPINTTQPSAVPNPISAAKNTVNTAASSSASTSSSHRSNTGATAPRQQHTSAGVNSKNNRNKSGGGSANVVTSAVTIGAPPVSTSMSSAAHTKSSPRRRSTSSARTPKRKGQSNVGKTGGGGGSSSRDSSRSRENKSKKSDKKVVIELE